MATAYVERGETQGAIESLGLFRYGRVRSFGVPKDAKRIRRQRCAPVSRKQLSLNVISTAGRRGAPVTRQITRQPVVYFELDISGGIWRAHQHIREFDVR